MTTNIWQPYDNTVGESSSLPTGVHVGGTELVVDVLSSGDADSTVSHLGDGIVEVRVQPGEQSTVRVAWAIPAVNVTAYWEPDSGRHRGLPPFWGRPRTAALEYSAPVGCLVGVGDVSLCTFASGEVVRPVRTRTGVVEETGEFGFWVEHEAGPEEPFRLRIDMSRRGFAATLLETADWWQADVQRPPVPEAARRPAYSTWYSMHQFVDAAGIERQAELSAELGCEVIIVDDGWHSTDRGRGYGYVGEWEPSPGAFPDMAAHVARVKETGLAYMLWYALPFVGKHTALFEQLEPYTLTFHEHMNAAVVDPRYPIVRELLVEKLSGAVREWGTDGLKVDFIDQFAIENPPAPGPEADCDTVNEGVRRLFADLGKALPGDVLVELRQPYVSPGLWPYAAMVRAADCPLSPLQNRQRTVDLRLTAGPLAVHADMMMWHPTETPEQVAVQLLNALFSVPQISVDLATQTPGQLAVLRFWTAFAKRHEAVLQHGEFRPVRPDLQYPLVSASNGGTTITARYAPIVVPLPEAGEFLLANADDSTDVRLEVSRARTAQVTVVDCAGTPVAQPHAERPLDLVPGVRSFTVPAGGLLTITG